MRIWLTVLAEGFSLPAGFVLLFKSCFVSHKLARKASNPEVSPEQCLNDKLKDELKGKLPKVTLSCERLGLRVQNQGLELSKLAYSLDFLFLLYQDKRKR
jgi:hypothetical protein